MGWGGARKGSGPKRKSGSCLCGRSLSEKGSVGEKCKRCYEKGRRHKLGIKLNLNGLVGGWKVGVLRPRTLERRRVERKHQPTRPCGECGCPPIWGYCLNSTCSKGKTMLGYLQEVTPNVEESVGVSKETA